MGRGQRKIIPTLFDFAGDWKRCCQCGMVKHLSDFYRAYHRPDGVQSACKACVRSSGNSYYHRSKKMPIGQERATRARIRKLERRYGLAPGTYAKMLAAQSGVCAICGKPETRRTRNRDIRRMDVDHDHDTGKVRSLLCNNCNSGLARFLENPSLLEKAAEYLRKHGKT